MRYVFTQPNLNVEKMVLFMIISFICIDLLKLLDCISRFEGKNTVQLPTRCVQLKLYPPCLNLLNLLFSSLMIIAILVVEGRCLILHHDNYDIYSQNKIMVYYIYSNNMYQYIPIISQKLFKFFPCPVQILSSVIAVLQEVYQYLLKCSCCWPFFFYFCFLLASSA